MAERAMAAPLRHLLGGSLVRSRGSIGPLRAPGAAGAFTASAASSAPSALLDGLGQRRAFSRRRDVRPKSMLANWNPESDSHREVSARLQAETGCTEVEAQRAVGSWGHRELNRNKVEHCDLEAIAPRIAALKSHLKLSNEEAKVVVLRLPSLLGLELEERLEPLCGVVMSRMKIDDTRLMKNLFLRWPALMGLRWENFGALQGGLVENLAFNNHSIDELHVILDLDSRERRGTNRIVNMFNQMDEEDTGTTIYRTRVVDPRKRKAFLEDGGEEQQQV